jgi:hypothetical protein
MEYLVAFIYALYYLTRKIEMRLASNVQNR